MEFINFEEATEALQSVNLTATMRDEDHLHLVYDDDDPEDQPSYLHLADPSADIEAQNDARVIHVEKDKLADSVEAMIGLLHLSQVLAIPVGKWRSVFDAVAFSLATNEDWQEVDAMATLRLNKRDPLLCEPGDYHTLHAVIEALFQDAESPDQGIIVTSTGKPFYAEVVPAGAVRVMVGDAVLADEIVEGLHIEG